MDKEEASKAIESLRPHFIFNTLNITRYLILNDPEKAYELVRDLSFYLRGHFGAQQIREKIPFTEEIKYIKGYLHIEQLNYSGLYVNYCWENVDFSIEAGAGLIFIEAFIKKKLKDKNQIYHIEVSSYVIEEQPILKVQIEENNVYEELKA